jgi:predicted dehydrogenase
MKILMVGLGAIGQRHARNLRRLLGPELELLACRVLRRQHVISDALEIEAGSTVEASLGVRVASDLDAALAESPDAVFVTNPTALHLEVAVRAARAGCALFVEKPLAASADGIEELQRIVEERRLVACVGYQLRFHPCFERVVGLLAAGSLGRVVGVRALAAERLTDWHPYEDYRESYAARAELGGGVLLTQCHELDYLCAWFGMPRRVFALGGRLGDLALDVEDTASVLLECESQGRSLPAHLHLDYLQRPPERSCEVLGERGRLRVDFRAAAVDALWEDGSRERFEVAGFDRNEIFLAEAAHFLACLRGQEVPRVGLREAAASLGVALAARRSLASGEPVTL